MSLVRVHNFAVSLDGFSTGEGQSLEQPFGHAGPRLLDRFLGTRTYHQMHGEPGGSTGADEAFASNRHRCRDYGSQQIWTTARPMGRRGLEWLVG
jgi:hypothetical protein